MASVLMVVPVIFREGERWLGEEPFVGAFGPIRS